MLISKYQAAQVELMNCKCNASTAFAFFFFHVQCLTCVPTLPLSRHHKRLAHPHPNSNACHTSHDPATPVSALGSNKATLGVLCFDLSH